MFDINNRYKLGILQNLIDVKVTRVSAKHVRLSMNWETKPHYKELYYASMDITAVVPQKLGRRLLITPYHRIYDGDDVEIVDIQNLTPFIKLDLSDYDETENESYTNKAFYILQHSGYDVIEIKDWEDETDISN